MVGCIAGVWLPACQLGACSVADALAARRTPLPLQQGIVNRLAVDEAEVEERVFVEAITNQYESREAVKYAGGCCRCCCRCAWVCCVCCACSGWVWAGMCLRIEQQLQWED